jgi:hypothetical protein
MAVSCNPAARAALEDLPVDRESGIEVAARVQPARRREAAQPGPLRRAAAAAVAAPPAVIPSF